MGYLPSNDSIYVVFRGSISILNWMTDLTTTKTAYTTFPECNCQVHDGFFKAEQKVIGGVINEIHRLKTLHPTARVVSTGHSLGAALSQLTAMDLAKAGFNPTLINFGQPRTGDHAYSTFAKTKLPIAWRLVHYKDPVPHVPTDVGLDFWQTCTEIYEDDKGNLKQCDSSCEDPNCGDQWASWQLRDSDHAYYLGKYIEGCGSLGEEPFLQ